MFSCSIFNPRVFEAGVSLLKYERRFQSQISMWTGVHKLKETLLLSFGSWHENRRMRFFFPFGFQHCHHLQLSVWFKTGSGSSGLINTARHRGGGAECLGSTSPREWCWCIWSSYIVSHRNRAAPPPPFTHTHTHLHPRAPPGENQYVPAAGLMEFLNCQCHESNVVSDIRSSLLTGPLWHDCEKVFVRPPQISRRTW